MSAQPDKTHSAQAHSAKIRSAVESTLTAESRLKSDVQFAAQITCILSDVDGVLTDGQITYSSRADKIRTETKSFHVRDGLGIKLWQRSGFHFGIITARESPLVAHRAAELGVSHVIQSSKDKWESATQLMKIWSVDASQVCYIGDDLPDLCVMRRVGLAVAPEDAATDAREHAHWTMARGGGHGVVRELIERLLRASGNWHRHVDRLSHAETSVAVSKTRHEADPAKGA